MTTVAPPSSCVRWYIANRLTIGLLFTARDPATGYLRVLAEDVVPTAGDAMAFFRFSIQSMALQLTSDSARGDAQAWLDSEIQQALVLRGLREHRQQSFETAEDGWCLRVTGNPRTTRSRRQLVTAAGVQRRV